MTTGSTFNTSPDKITHKRKTIEDGRKKPIRSAKQNDWARTSWLNHGIAGTTQALINLLKAHKLYAEAGQVASAVKKVQALNVKAYKDRWPKLDSKKQGVDTPPTV
jgi:hypothetical protein